MGAGRLSQMNYPAESCIAVTAMRVMGLKLALTFQMVHWRMVALTDSEDADSLRTPQAGRFSTYLVLLGLFSLGAAVLACWAYL